MIGGGAARAWPGWQSCTHSTTLNGILSDEEISILDAEAAAVEAGREGGREKRRGLESEGEIGSVWEGAAEEGKCGKEKVVQ